MAKTSKKSADTVIQVQLWLTIEKNGKRFMAHSPDLDMSVSEKALKKARKNFSEKTNIPKALEGLGWSYSVYPKKADLFAVLEKVRK